MPPTFDLKLTDLSGAVVKRPVLTSDGVPVISIKTASVEPGAAGEEFRIPIGTVDGGLAADKVRNPRGYTATSQSGIDATWPSFFTLPPKTNGITLTSAVAMASNGEVRMAVEFASNLFIMSGRYIHSVNTSHSVSTSLDLGSGDIGTWMTVVDDNLFVCCGNTDFVQKRTSAGVWSASADVYAQVILPTRRTIWRVRNGTGTIDNSVSGIDANTSTLATAMMTNANWTSPGSSAGYVVGDNSYQVLWGVEYQGGAWFGRADGMFQNDTEGNYFNRTPQLRESPDVGNCFPGDTLVRLDESVSRVTRRWFDGKVRNLTTAAGYKLTGTPNHPVLTDKGWVALSALKEGDRIVSRIPKGRLEVVEPNVNDVEATLEEVFNAAAVVGVSQRKRSGPPDFHGDGRDGEVDIVLVNRELWDGVKASLFKEQLEFSLPSSNNALGPLSSNASVSQFTGGKVAPPPYNPSLPEHGAALLFGHRSQRELHGLGLGSHSNARILEPAANGRRTNTKLRCNPGRGEPAFVQLPRDSQGRFGFHATQPDSIFTEDQVNLSGTNQVFLSEDRNLFPVVVGSNEGGVVVLPARVAFGKTNLNPGLNENPLHDGLRDTVVAPDTFHPFTTPVTFDDVVSLEWQDFSGHVYNLETETHRFTANDIIVHNCLGSAVIFGSLFVPSKNRGLLRVRTGESIAVGPEQIGTPNKSWWVRSMVEHNRAAYLLATDEQGTRQSVLKMVPDDLGISGQEYVFHELQDVVGTNKSPWLQIFQATTNPELFWGGGSATTTATYSRLGRGGGRDIDDSNYQMNGTGELITGNIRPSAGRSMQATLHGVDVYTTMLGTSPSLTVTYNVDDFVGAEPATTMYTNREAASGSSVSSSGRARFYATTSGATGSTFNFKFALAQSGTPAGTTRSMVHEAYAFGVLKPILTDYIQLTLDCADGDGVGQNGIRIGKRAREVYRQCKAWQRDNSVLTMNLAEYEEDKTVRVIVVDATEEVKETREGTNRPKKNTAVTLVLKRMDYAGAYGT